MNRFALIGAAGYIAPRHMKAIKEINGDLLAALDVSDSVGIMDQYFPNSLFFTQFERFDRFVDKMRRSKNNIEYVSICSPNFLHDSHIRFALRSGSHAICEKPIVLNEWNLDGLQELQSETNQKVNTILQLRLHPSIIEIKEKIERAEDDHVYDVDLTYITSRGKWYFTSWKGDEKKSGGIASNIGIHFFDMLHYLFGELKENIVHLQTPAKCSGYLEFKKARVRWFLSIDNNDLPQNTLENQTTFRSITLDGQEIEFSSGFTDLHTQSYEKILAGKGFGLEDVRPSLQVVSSIRDARVDPARGELHPFNDKAK